MVAVACQAFLPDGADDWTAARLAPPLVTVAPPPSRTLPAAHVAVLVLDTVPAAALLAIEPALPVTTVEPERLPAAPVAPVAPAGPVAPVAPVVPAPVAPVAP